jgi:4-hydroxy-tetrahydrodipicolinate synthase
MNKKWGGIFAALWTSTDKEGRVSDQDLQRNIAFLRGHGIHGLMVLGSTGEFLHLDVEARKRFAVRVVELLSPLPAIFNVTEIRPRVVAELARHARENGAAAIALLPPYFYPLAQADLIEWFVRAGEAAQLPLFLYNFPERVGNCIALETLAAVADRTNVAGIKQSGAAFEYNRELVKLGREKNFAVFAGSDTRIAEAMSFGVAGCIGGLGDVVPDLMVEIFNAVKAGTPERAALASERMKTLGKLVETLEFPLNVAAAIEARGLPAGHPKSVVSPATQSRYQELVGKLKKLFGEWKLI